MTEAVDKLGSPLTAKQVAELIGCSRWTVRYRHIPLGGLPHFRASANGKLIFYHDQVVRWILHKQRQGGMTSEPAQAGQRLVGLLLRGRSAPPEIDRKHELQTSRTNRTK